LTTPQGDAKVQDYVDAGGLRTYYEAEGAGEALVLLHGGFCTIETFGGLTPKLAEQYRVYPPERRAHGRTPDVEGPITYEIMAQDTIAFLDAVDLSSAHLVGWSDGAVVGLLVALRRPDLVRRLVMISQNIN
jgi:pimeloyl-ACP methyl ester carboxylesterase